jgi:hypothetical protein
MGMPAASPIGRSSTCCARPPTPFNAPLTATIASSTPKLMSGAMATTAMDIAPPMLVTTTVAFIPSRSAAGVANTLVNRNGTVVAAATKPILVALPVVVSTSQGTATTVTIEPMVNNA